MYCRIRVWQPLVELGFKLITFKLQRIFLYFYNYIKIIKHDKWCIWYITGPNEKFNPVELIFPAQIQLKCAQIFRIFNVNRRVRKNPVVVGVSSPELKKESLARVSLFLTDHLATSRCRHLPPSRRRREAVKGNV